MTTCSFFSLHILLLKTSSFTAQKTIFQLAIGYLLHSQRLHFGFTALISLSAYSPSFLHDKA